MLLQNYKENSSYSSSLLGGASPNTAGISNQLRDKAHQMADNQNGENDAQSFSSQNSHDEAGQLKLTSSQLKRHNVTLAKQPFWTRLEHMGGASGATAL